MLPYASLFTRLNRGKLCSSHTMLPSLVQVLKFHRICGSCQRRSLCFDHNRSSFRVPDLRRMNEDAGAKRLSQRQVNEGTFLFLMPQFLRRGPMACSVAQLAKSRRRRPSRDTLSVSLGRKDQTVCVCQAGSDGGVLFPLIVRPISVGRLGGETLLAAGSCVTAWMVDPFGWGSYAMDAFWVGFDSMGQVHRCSVIICPIVSGFRESLIPFTGDVSEKGPAVIVSLEPEAESLLASYDQDARRNVRQAERAGGLVEIDRDCTRLEEFTIYYSTMDRRGACSIYYFPRQFLKT